MSRLFTRIFLARLSKLILLLLTTVKVLSKVNADNLHDLGEAHVRGLASTNKWEKKTFPSS